jgi:hypothetical protein
VIGVLVAAGKWLRSAENRATVTRTARELCCRHRWQPRDLDSDGLIILTLDGVECSKCDKRRSSMPAPGRWPRLARVLTGAQRRA